MVATLQERWFWCRGPAWRWERENFPRFRIGGITFWRLVPNVKRIGRIIGSDSTSHFETPRSPWEWFRSKEIGLRTSWSREMLNGVSLLMNSSLKDRIGRGSYIVLWPAMKNGSTTIIRSAENHGKCPNMPPRRRPDRIFTVRRLCSVFVGTISVLCIMSCWNRGKPSQGIGIERNWCVWV